MKRITLLVTFALVFLVIPAEAQLEWLQVSHSAVRCEDPAIACGPQGMQIIAWADAAGQVWSYQWPASAVPDGQAAIVPRLHGAGEWPRVAHTWFGFLVAWVDGSRIGYQFGGNGDFPEPAQYIETGGEVSYPGLDVVGIGRGYNVGWIVYDVQTAPDHHQITFLRLTKGLPEPPVVLAENTYYYGEPQVVAMPHWPEPTPRVYFAKDDGSFAYREEPEWQQWTGETVVPLEEYSSAFDVATGPLATQWVLANGPQPTCPCGTIGALQQDADGVWQPLENLTVHYDYYDWPRGPNIRVDSRGRAHAFWMQRSTNEQWTWSDATLEYWIHDDGAWTDAGAMLAPFEVASLAPQVAMDLDDRDHPVFAWAVSDTIDGVPQPQQIMAARVSYLTPVPGEAPAAAASLTAWPNPFNPVLNLAGRTSGPAPAALVVHDLTGRRVRTLTPTIGNDGRFTAQWDGNDTRGRTLPSGVYLVRLGVGAGAACVRAVLAR